MNNKHSRVFICDNPADAQDKIDEYLDKNYELVSVSTSMYSETDPHHGVRVARAAITVAMMGEHRYEPSSDVQQWLHDSFTGLTSDEQANKMVDLLHRRLRRKEDWDEIKEILG